MTMASNTFDVFARFCEQSFPDETRRGRIYNLLARKELLEEEAKLNKNFFDFSASEIEHYLSNLYNNAYRRSDKIRPSKSYLRNLVSYYRRAFAFYLAETGGGENPLEDKRFRYLGFKSQDNVTIFTRETLENLCLSIGDRFDPGDAEFTQLILWLFYSGCFSLDDILAIPQDGVDFVRNIVHLPDRNIHPQEECMELLRRNHEIESYKAYKYTNLMFPYHGSYVWFPYRMTKTPDGSDPYDYAYRQHQERTEGRVRDLISKRLTKIRNEIGVFIRPDALYYRGIYDYIVSKCGKQHAKEIIWSDTGRNTFEESDEFKQYLREYGARITDDSEIYKIKRSLFEFL